MKTRTIIVLFVVSAFGFAACGGSGEAAGLKHRVSDKELRGLTGEGVMRIETAKSEVTRLEDAVAVGVADAAETKKSLEATEDRKEAAGDKIEAAADKIEATQGAQEKELEQARGKRDGAIAAAKKRYEEETQQIRQKYAAEQDKNRKTLADAKTSKTLVTLEHNLHRAELAETTARQALRKQEIRVAKAQLEVVKFEELVKMTGVVGPKETQRKINLEQQALDEQKKLIDLQAKLLKAEQNTQAERTKLEAEKQKGTTN